MMMTNSLNRVAGYLFGGASLLMCLMIVLYFAAYQPPVFPDWQVQLTHINEHWGLISFIWTTEFLIVLAYGWVSFYFTRLTSWWYLLAIGHVFMLIEYGLMLGGYPQVTTEEGYKLVNGLAMWVFLASNFIWLLGMAGVYLTERGWLRYVGTGLSALSALSAFLLMTGVVGPEFMMVVGLLVVLLYLLNVYYGFRVLGDKG